MIEFVKNYLVKVESLCHYQTPCLRYHSSAKIFSFINQLAKYLSNKADLKINIITTDKKVTHLLIEYTYNSITNES